MSKEILKETETLLLARRNAWRHIDAITKDKSLTDREKLDQCMNVANTYCAMTGDDSLTPKPIRDARKQTIKRLDEILPRVAAIRKVREDNLKRGYQELI